MNIDSTTYKSPNYSERNHYTPTMLVLHATVGSAKSSLDWLCNPQPHDPDKRVSIHYLIDKSGHIYQLVDDKYAAWHAGTSYYRGLGSVVIRDCSLGIELENDNSGHDPYPQVQIDALIELSRALIGKYRISRDMVVRHLDIAIPVGRKTDPAGFPWTDYMNTLFTPPDPFAIWGTEYPLPIEQRGWGIPQTWLRQSHLFGAAISDEIYDTPDVSHRLFAKGFILYYKPNNRCYPVVF